MVSSWNFVEWMQSLMSITFIVGMSTGMSVLVSHIVVRSLRDEPASVVSFPASRQDAPALLKKAA